MVSTSASLSGGPCAMVATATAASIPTMFWFARAALVLEPAIESFS
jgi:hypothetical protein